MINSTEKLFITPQMVNILVKKDLLASISIQNKNSMNKMNSMHERDKTD